MVRRRAALCLLFGVIATYLTAWGAVGFGQLTLLNARQRIALDIPAEAMTWPWEVPTDWGEVTDERWSEAWGLRWREHAREADVSDTSQAPTHAAVANIARTDATESGTDEADGVRYVPLELEFSSLVAQRDPPAHVTTELRAGWPVASVRWWREATTAAAWTEQFDRGPVGAIRVESLGRTALTNFGSMGGWTPRWLPYRPIWPLLFANVAIWAVGSWCLWASVAWLVHGRRAGQWRRAGRCVACGYDLANLGMCPECGETSQSMRAS